MKKLLLIALSIFLIYKNTAAKSITNGDYSFLQEITFLIYDDNVPPYTIPVRLKTLEETLMFEVLHATQKDKKWFAYTMNSSLLGTFKVGQPALLEVGNIKKMYFVAGFPNSVGGLDLYVSEFKDGKWSKPSNLGKGINTIYNESNPGLLNDHTLTYSSNGIIKKLDLNTLQVTDSETQPAPPAKEQVSSTVTEKAQTTTAKIEERKEMPKAVEQTVVTAKDKKAEIQNTVNNQENNQVSNNKKTEAETIAAIGDNSTATPANTSETGAIGDNSTAMPVNNSAGMSTQQMQTKTQNNGYYANAETVEPKQKTTMPKPTVANDDIKQQQQNTIVANNNAQPTKHYKWQRKIVWF